MRYRPDAVADARRTRINAALTRRRSRSLRARARDLRAIASSGRITGGQCFVVSCTERAVSDAIGTYAGVFELEETFALALCERYTEALTDVLVIAVS